ncbi:hypothetical protein [Marinobacter salicampi]|uniref:hypothetical protein n=1 Tax=Marinobacter salicampi TaxID=435907 RepID=UPI00140D0A04|nr:hypothetical protein [Marinobacter salicampi]
MNWTLGKVSTAVYVTSFVIVAMMAAYGQLGSVNLTTTVGWVLVAWLAAYQTIFTLLVGGTFRWVALQINQAFFKPSRF